MNSNDTARAIARALALRPGLFDCHVYAHDLQVKPTGEEVPVSAEEGIELPAVLVRVKCESLSGSDTIGRARIEIDVESQVDDSSIAQHGDREREVRTGMADIAALQEACVAVGGVKFLGKVALGETDPEAEQRAFKTPLNYKAGVQDIR